MVQITLLPLKLFIFAPYPQMLPMMFFTVVAESIGEAKLMLNEYNPHVWTKKLLDENNFITWNVPMEYFKNFKGVVKELEH